MSAERERLRAVAAAVCVIASMPAALDGDINAYAIAFLDHYVLGAAAAPALTQALSGVSELRFDSELGHGGTSATRAGERARAQP